MQRLQIGTFCSITLLAAFAPAQVALFSVDGDAAGDHFGASLAAVGDVDGDGFGDLAIGAPYNSGAGGNFGQVKVVSGRTHNVIRTWYGSSALAHFGWSLAACGDLDLDARADVIVGAPGDFNLTGGAVYAISGASGAVIRTWIGARGFGHALAANGDATGDGIADVLVAESVANTVTLFDGATGVLLRQHVDGGDFAQSVTFIGDVNGDGRAEYIAGYPTYSGEAIAYSATAVAPLWHVYGSVASELGFALAGVGDLSGDSVPDVVIGAHDWASWVSTGKGYFEVRHGANGALIQRVYGQIYDAMLGCALAAVGDLDGDGRGDFAAAQPGPYGGTTGSSYEVRVIRGSDRAVIAVLAPSNSQDGWGCALGFGDVSGDGLADVIVGAQRRDSNGQDAGSVFVYTLVRAPVVYCDSESNSLACTPSIAGVGTPSATLASPFNIRATSVLNQKSGFLFYGFKPRQAPYHGGFNCIAAPTKRTPAQNSGGSAPPANDCSGVFTLDFNARIQSAVDPLLVMGEEVFVQYWSRDPVDASTTNLTDALAFYINP